MSLIVALGQLADIAKKINDKALSDVVLEFNREVISLQQHVSDLQNQKFDVEKKCRDLETNITQLKQAGCISKELIRKNDAYWRKDGDGPICTGCFDKEGKVIFLHVCGNPAYAKCPVCTNDVHVWPEKDQEPFDTGEVINFDPYQ